MIKEEISVIVIAYNEEGYIGDCIRALLNQTVHDFTLILVDDGSTDNTWGIINNAQDTRISRVRIKKRSGYATARNEGLKLVKEGIAFFTDADCRPEKNWIEEGLIVFKKDGSMAVSGSTKRVLSNTNLGLKDMLTFSCVSLVSLPGFGTNNVAYRVPMLHSIGGFSKRYNNGFEDIDLLMRVAARASRKEKFIFAKEMVVVHVKKKYTLQRIFLWLKRMKQIVYILKDHHALFEQYDEKKVTHLRQVAFSHKLFINAKFFWIIRPFYLLIIVFPPLLYFSFKKNNIKLTEVKEIAYIPLAYGYILYLRMVVWITAIEERFFVI